ncbi:MAG: OmpA family protein [Azonexus sp.]|uniref:OmpA family protein n=1 Tax=Azonexus sp. TaxID=1872668 RepID=UPI002836493C|nr:OmpA family protein [Azonexus sp.]MDR0777694.1 OmpA family protein [Azonexus sp.]
MIVLSFEANPFVSVLSLFLEKAMSHPIRFSFFRKIIQGVALVAATLAFAAPGYAAKPATPPDKDHPLVGRYEGSKLIFHQAPKFDELDLIKVPMDRRSSIKPEMLHLEGNVSFYYYDLPEGRTTLEVLRNYESSLKAKGFEILASCGAANGSCYTDKAEKNPLWLAHALNDATRWAEGKYPNGDWILNAGGMGYACEEGNTRYLHAKRGASDGTTHVNLVLCDRGTSRAYVAVVESRAMDTDKIAFVDASAMQKSLDATGRVNLYGIYFDTDKDTIKPESKPTLDEIGKLMKSNPQLRLQVVGHTDSTGNDAHNKDLSNRRAASVIRVLAQAGIDAKRFASRGAGASEPVAGNDNEEGRAKNRRVELVRM